MLFICSKHFESRCFSPTGRLVLLSVLMSMLINYVRVLCQYTHLSDLNTMPNLSMKNLKKDICGAG